MAVTSRVWCFTKAPVGASFELQGLFRATLLWADTYNQPKQRTRRLNGPRDDSPCYRAIRTDHIFTRQARLMCAFFFFTRPGSQLLENHSWKTSPGKVEIKMADLQEKKKVNQVSLYFTQHYSIYNPLCNKLYIHTLRAIHYPLLCCHMFVCKIKYHHKLLKKKSFLLHVLYLRLQFETHL